MSYKNSLKQSAAQTAAGMVAYVVIRVRFLGIKRHCPVACVLPCESSEQEREASLAVHFCTISEETVKKSIHRNKVKSVFRLLR